MPATLRSIVGAVAAVPIALGLFYLMQSLIDTQFEQEDVNAEDRRHRCSRQGH